VRIGITGLGVHVPDRVVTNDDLAQYVDTTDEWIQERTGIRERRMARDGEALTDIALPAARAALRRRRRGRDRPPHLRDGDAGHDVPHVVGADGRRARCPRRCGI
jgi:hypothetical protein